MNPECQKVLQWLDEAAGEAPSPGLEAHARGCEACRRRLAMEQAMRQGLAAGAALDPARREALVRKIVSAPAAAAPRRIRRVWPWAAVAAAAAVIVAILVHQPTTLRPPVSPTEIFGDVLGPLAEATPIVPAPAPAPAEDTSPFGMALAAVFGDLEGPLDIGRQVMAASRTAAAVAAAPAESRTAAATTGKEK